MDLIMGMNSGSSFDGIDVILAETEVAEDGFPRPPKFLCGGSYEWPEDVASIVRDAFVNKVDMVGLNRLNYICGAVFAEKAARFMKENGIDAYSKVREKIEMPKISVAKAWACAIGLIKVDVLKPREDSGPGDEVIAPYALVQDNL